MPPRIFLNSIPKAGAHLAERALTELGCHRGRGPLGSATVIGRHQWVKSLVRRPLFTGDLALVGIEIAVPVRASWLRRRLDQVSLGQYVRGHVQHSGYFAALLEERGYRLLHVVRDPRDVVVSHAHYMLARPRHPFHSFYKELGDWEARLAFSISGGLIPGVAYLASIAERYRLMEGWRSYPGALMVRFEDLVGSSGGGSRDAQIAALESLRRLLEIGSVDLESVAERIFGASSTFRKGRVGGWKESFSTEGLERFDATAGDLLERWGYGTDGSAKVEERFGREGSGERIGEE